MTAEGYCVFAVSYDAVEVLSAFAAEHGTDFPLMSDVGSRVITELGLRNEIVPSQAAAYGVQYRSEYDGVPHPGTFVLDEDGIVVDRWFEESYRLRSSGAVMVERLTGRADAADALVSVDAPGEGVRVRAWSADAIYRPWTEIVVHFDVAIDDELHLYAPPTPPGFHPLDISVRNQPALYVGPVSLPEGQPFTMGGLSEAFLVYGDLVRASVAVTMIENRGPIELTFEVSFQACTDTACLMPQTLVLALPFEGGDHGIQVPPLPGY